MKLYLAGPMRGFKDFNFPAFDTAARALRKQGHTVFNPAERDRNLGFDEKKNTLVGFDLAGAMKADLQYIVNEADGIALIQDWQVSRGANLESYVALSIGLKVFVVDAGGILTDVTDSIAGSAKVTYTKPITPEAEYEPAY